jgi:hypothetical protein
VFTAYLHVDRTVAKGKCCQRELLARPYFAWNVSAVVFYELSNKGWRHVQQKYKRIIEIAL